MGSETPAGETIRLLHELRDAIAAASPELAAEMVPAAGDRPAHLKVVNRHAGALSDRIECVPNVLDGCRLWFTFSWGEPICPASEFQLAAKEISRVLSCRMLQTRRGLLTCAGAFPCASATDHPASIYEDDLMIVLAHISDLHLDGSERNARRAERAMAFVNDLPDVVDAVLVTGDIADHGRPDEYEEARKILVSPHRVLTCPGNHDARGPFRQVLLGEEPGGEPVNRVHRLPGAVIAMCDSGIPGRDDGFLDDATLEWLETVLAESGELPVFVCFHHPPVVLHNAFIDGLRQHGAERLAEVIARFPGVVAILCGHAHTPAASTFAGRPLLVAPGVVSTLRLPWESGAELRYDLPPAVALHVLDDDRRLTTHYRTII